MHPRTPILHYSAFPDTVTDADLLARFVADRDAAAFELLVWRHAGMVLRVCRGILGSHHDAEDACQATFLALARQASAVGRGSVAGWLYRVARRTAVRAAARVGRPPAASPDLLDQIPTPDRPDQPDPALVRALHDEVARLPERYRVAVLLCFFECLTHRVAAERLGVPIGTLSARVARGEALLRRRLSARGLGASAALLVGASTGGRAGAEPTFVAATARAAIAFAAGDDPGLSDVVLELARGITRSLVRAKIRWAVGLITVCGAAVLGGLWIAGAQEPPKPPPAKTEAKAKTEPGGKPLPSVPALRARLDADLGILLTDVSADGTRLLTTSFALVNRFPASHRSRVWDVAAGKEMPIPNELRDCIAFTPDGKHLVAFSPDWHRPSRISLYDWATGKEVDVVHEVRQLDGALPPQRFFGFTPDGKQLIFAPPHDTRLWFWDLAARKAARTEFPAGSDRSSRPNKPIFVNGGRQVVLTVQGDFERATHGSVVVWSVNPPKKVMDLAGGATFFFNSVLSPDGKWLAVDIPLNEAGQNRAVRVWDTAAWTEAATLPGASTPFFTAGSRALITRCQDPDRIVHWSCGTWKPTSAHTPVDSHLSGFTIHPSPDGRWVAYSSAQLTRSPEKGGEGQLVSQVRLLEVASGRDELLCDRASPARWLPDGRTLALDHNRFTDERYHPMIELWDVDAVRR